MSEHHQILAMPALHQIHTEKAASADAEAQSCGEGGIVGFRLGGPCVHGAERHEDRNSELLQLRRSMDESAVRWAAGSPEGRHSIGGRSEIAQ
ncbi:hypothetical protein ACFWNK_38025 [Streptomyces sp. NPDC058417]|uniref:hypothetical protein n=1 Tax=unclassified Streptomyces TaxID=2593676 RepID=UPI00365B67B7